MTATIPELGTDPAALEPWITILEEVVPKDQNGLLVRLGLADENDFELGVLPLDGVHPAELLDGFEAPREWLALGLVCRGWALPMDGERPSKHPKRRRVLSTVLLDRSGNTVGRTIGENGEVVVDGPPPEGELLRLLRLAMGLDGGHDGG